MIDDIARWSRPRQETEMRVNHGNINTPVRVVPFDSEAKKKKKKDTSREPYRESEEVRMPWNDNKQPASIANANWRMIKTESSSKAPYYAVVIKVQPGKVFESFYPSRTTSFPFSVWCES